MGTPWVTAPPPPSHTSPYLIVEQRGDAAIVGCRRGFGDPLGDRRPLLQLILLLTSLLSKEAMLPKLGAGGGGDPLGWCHPLLRFIRLPTSLLSRDAIIGGRRGNGDSLGGCRPLLQLILLLTSLLSKEAMLP